MIVVIFSVLWGCHGVIYSFSFESSVSSLYSLQKCFYFVQVIFVLISCMVCRGLTSKIVCGQTLINSLSSV